MSDEFREAALAGIVASMLAPYSRHHFDQCDMPGECGELCHCGEYVVGHGYTLGHSAVPMLCLTCEARSKRTTAMRASCR